MKKERNAKRKIHPCFTDGFSNNNRGVYKCQPNEFRNS